MAKVTITIKGLEAGKTLVVGHPGLAGSASGGSAIAAPKAAKGAAFAAAKGKKAALVASRADIEGGHLLAKGKVGGHGAAVHALGGHGVAVHAAAPHVAGVHAAAPHVAALPAAGATLPAVSTTGFGTGVLKAGAGASLKTGAAGAGAGTLWAGLGFFGPILIVASLGLIATGIYLSTQKAHIEGAHGAT